MIALLLAVASAADFVPESALADPTVIALDAERTVFTEDARLADGFAVHADAWWVRDPMLWIADSGQVTALIRDALAVQPSAVGWVGPVRLGFGAPVYLFSDGDARGPQGAQLGDARLDLKMVLTLGGNAGIAPIARLFVPLGADAALLGRSGVAWEAGLAGDLLVGSTLLAVNLGSRGLPPDQLTGLVMDDQLWYRASGSVVVGPGSVGLELQGHTQYNAFLSDADTSPLEGLLVGTAPLGARTTLRAGLGTALIGGVGAPAGRLTLGIGYNQPAQHYHPTQPEGF